MLLFEMKKIIYKPVNKIALMILAASLMIVCFFAVDSMRYVNEEGNAITGARAAKGLRDDKNQWAGYVTADVLMKVVEENAAYIASKEYSSDDIQEQDKAYAKTQGYSDIRDIINVAFTRYQEYDYYRVDNVTAEEVGKLYEKRISNLEEWLNTGEETFTDAEKQFLIKQYEKLETPFYYEYKDGWETLVDLSYTPTLIILLALITGFLVSGIFSDEFHLNADSIFYSSKLGRNKAVRTKIVTGFLVVTLIYWIVILLYTVIVLALLGADGAECAIQINHWKSFYNITIFQEYVLIVLGGYVGILFILTFSMLVSALTHSTVVALTIPFIFTCVTPFIGKISVLTRILGLFPDQLMQMGMVVKYSVMYQIGGKLIASIPILFTIYLVLYVILLPGLYHVYRRVEINK